MKLYAGKMMNFFAVSLLCLTSASAAENQLRGGNRDLQQQRPGQADFICVRITGTDGVVRTQFPCSTQAPQPQAATVEDGDSSSSSDDNDRKLRDIDASEGNEGEDDEALMAQP